MKNYFNKLKIALCILSIGVVTTNIYAQEEQSGSKFAINYGIKGGVNFHEFSNQPHHMGGKMGLSLGAFGFYEFNDLIALQVELGYFQQGGTYVQFIDDTRFGASENFFTRNVKDGAVTLHNIYIPVQARLSLFSQAYLPKLFVGPYLDINFAATEKYETTGELDDNVYTTVTGDAVVTDQYETFQLGAVAGIEFNIPTDASWDLILGINYKYGLTPAKKSYSYIDYYVVKEDFNTSALSITLGVQF